MSVDISLIVVNHKTPADVERCLQSLIKVAPAVPYEVIVVNTTGEGAYALSPADPPGCRVLSLAQNRGFGAAVNEGIACAGGRYLLPMNADIIFQDDALSPMVAHLDANAQTGVLVPRLLNPDGTMQYNVRMFYRWRTILCRRSFVGKLFPGESRRHLMMDADHTTSFPAPWGMGAALCCRRSLLDAGRLFDERFFLYFEDVDLCVRAWRAGLRVVYTPAATLMHNHQRASAVSVCGGHARMHLASLWAFWRKYGTLQPVLADVWNADGV